MPDQPRQFCVLFDLDGTLYDSPEYSERLEQEIARFVSDRISVNLEQTKAVLQERRRELGTLTKTLESLGIDREDFFESMAARIEPTDYIRSNPSLRSIIETLKKRGFKVALVSNSGRPLVEKILKALGLEQSLFDAVITSSEVRPKPSPEPFLEALRRTNCEKVDAVYVGDRDEAELRPAKMLGIRTILLDRKGASQSRWADSVVSDLTQIPDSATRVLAH